MTGNILRNEGNERYLVFLEERHICASYYDGQCPINGS